MKAARWHTLWGSCKAKATFQVPVVNDMSSLLKWKMEDRSNSATGGWLVKKKKRVGEKKVRRVQRWKIHERMLCDRAWKWGREGRREKGDGTDSGQRMGGSIGRKRRERERDWALGVCVLHLFSIFLLLSSAILARAIIIRRDMLGRLLRLRLLLDGSLLFLPYRAEPLIRSRKKTKQQKKKISYSATTLREIPRDRLSP